MASASAKETSPENYCMQSATCARSSCIVYRCHDILHMSHCHVHDELQDHFQISHVIQQLGAQLGSPVLCHVAAPVSLATVRPTWHCGTPDFYLPQTLSGSRRACLLHVMSYTKMQHVISWWVDLQKNATFHISAGPLGRSREKRHVSHFRGPPDLEKNATFHISAGPLGRSPPLGRSREKRYVSHSRAP